MSNLANLWAVTVPQPFTNSALTQGVINLDSRPNLAAGQLIAVHSSHESMTFLPSLWPEDEYPSMSVIGYAKVLDVHQDRDCISKPWHPVAYTFCQPGALLGHYHVVLGDQKRISPVRHYRRHDSPVVWKVPTTLAVALAGTYPVGGAHV